jgi:ABC-type nitrate/sulfonate/bicarbonate transport system permease component
MAKRSRRLLARFNWLGCAVTVALLVIWQLLVTTKIIDYAPLPGPIGVANGLAYLAGNGMWSELAHTLRCVAIAWGIAIGIGGFAGLLLGLNATVASWTNATVDVFRSMPIVAFIPIAILIWGTGSQAEVILGAYAGVWPMLLNTSGGARGVPAQLRDVAKTLRLSRVETLRKIVVPSTGAAMLVGARLSLATALVVCVVSEMLGLQSGVGNALVLEQSADQPERVLAYVLVIGTLGILVNVGVVWLFRLLFPGVAANSEQRAT